MRKLKSVIWKALHPQRGIPKGEPLFLNEAVNFEMEVIFIAVPKTGTTSIRRQLKQIGRPIIPNPHLDILQVRESLYLHYLRQLLGRTTTFPCDTVATDEFIRNRAKESFESFFKFSAVRNPWARAVSLYYRREGIQTSGDITFEDFCQNHVYASDTCIHPTLHKNQIDWLCDENGVVLMDYVYKLEEFDRALNEIAELTNGRLRLESKTHNTNPTSLAPKYRSLYTDQTRNLIAKRFEKDIDYFKYTF